MNGAMPERMTQSDSPRQIGPFKHPRKAKL